MAPPSGADARGGAPRTEDCALPRRVPGSSWVPTAQPNRSSGCRRAPEDPDHRGHSSGRSEVEGDLFLERYPSCWPRWPGAEVNDATRWFAPLRGGQNIRLHARSNVPKTRTNPTRSRPMSIQRFDPFICGGGDCCSPSGGRPSAAVLGLTRCSSACSRLDLVGSRSHLPQGPAVRGPSQISLGTASGPTRSIGCLARGH